MRRSLVLFGAAALAAALSFPVSAAPPDPLNLVTDWKQVYCGIKSQTLYLYDVNLDTDPNHSCPAPDVVSNPTNCVWDTDDAWSMVDRSGTIRAGETVTATICAVADGSVAASRLPRQQRRLGHACHLHPDHLGSDPWRERRQRTVRLRAGRLGSRSVSLISIERRSPMPRVPIYTSLDGEWHLIVEGEHTKCGLVIPHGNGWSAVTPEGETVHCDPDSKITVSKATKKG